MIHFIRFAVQILWFVLGAMVAASAQANVYTWNGLSNPFFNNTAAWTPNGPPSVDDTASFGPASTYNVFFDTSPTINDLNVLAGNVTFASFISPPITSSRSSSTSDSYGHRTALGKELPITKSWSRMR